MRKKLRDKNKKKNKTKLLDQKVVNQWILTITNWETKNFPSLKGLDKIIRTDGNKTWKNFDLLESKEGIKSWNEKKKKNSNISEKRKRAIIVENFKGFKRMEQKSQWNGKRKPD